MDLGLQNKRVLITGSTAGIGKDMAKGFLKEGAKVIVHGRNKEKLKGVVEELLCFGKDRIEIVEADIATEEGVKEMVKQVHQIGTLDVLVHNAAVCYSQDFYDIQSNDLREIFEVNVFSALYLSQAFLPPMKKQNFGRIIHIASEAAFKPYPKLLSYSMSKAALVNLSKGLSELVSGSNITVNSILPGPTLTNELHEFIFQKAEKENVELDDLKSEILKRNNPTSVIGRFIEMDEVAGVVLYLASKQAGAITGSAIRVEGGIISTI